IEYLIVKGNAPSGSKVRFKVEYSNNFTGILKLSGIAAQEEVVADAKGQFSSSHIKLSKHLSSPGLIFTITAVAIDQSGRESRPSVVKAYGRAF
ncbi:MAG: hypothetical protein GX825_07965, partial [Syntrophomonadaceae bacterium]|nr:hypothetical protein [Syntrophomonadaceae bacterium]